MSKPIKKFVLRDDYGDPIELPSNLNDSTPKEQEKEELYPTVAFSVARLSTGEWVMVEVPINPDTKQAGEFKIHKEDGSKIGAIERFKIEFANFLL